MRYLITGGAGFIGSNFVNNLFEGTLDLDFSHVKVIDALTYAGSLDNINKEILESPQFSFIHGDISDSGVLEKELEDIDIVVNFAAESHVDRSIAHPMGFVDSNVKGTVTLLNAIRFKKSIRFIQVSTDEVYGSISNGKWSEDSPLAPNSPYAASKASADLFCLSFSHTYDLNLIITRCCNNYGPNQYPEKLIPFFVKRLVNGLTIPIYGDGLQTREWIHVFDHCRGIASAIRTGKAGNVYHFGSNTSMTNLTLSKLILNHLQLSEESIEFVPDRLGHDFRYALDFSKSEKMLGHKNIVEFNQGLSETIDWFVKKFS